MKMIALTKLSKAQQAMQAGKQYGQANASKALFSSCIRGFDALTFRLTLSLQALHRCLLQQRSLRRYPLLCHQGHTPCHSQRPRLAICLIFQRGGNAATQIDPESPIMVIGDKSKAQLTRAAPNNLRLTFNQIGRDVPTFADAAGSLTSLRKVVSSTTLSCLCTTGSYQPSRTSPLLWKSRAKRV
jgi:F-type H+-transporting ATPase subunit gamma